LVSEVESITENRPGGTCPFHSACETNPASVN
jgi:hypothetical protein